MVNWKLILIPRVVKFVVCCRLLIIDLGKLTSKLFARTDSSITRSRSVSHNRRPDICFLSTIMSIFLNALLSSEPSRSISVSFVALTPSSSPMLNHLLRTSNRLLYTAAKSSRVRATGMINGMTTAGIITVVTVSPPNMNIIMRCTPAWPGRHIKVGRV